MHYIGLIFHPVLKYIEDLVAVKVERSTRPEVL
jgi:hypothetical protein